MNSYQNIFSCNSIHQPVVKHFKNDLNKRVDNETVHSKIFYFNDTHGRISCMEELKEASNNFRENPANKQVDIFTLSAGDSLIGKNKQKNKLWIEYQNDFLDYSAIGNHEFDDNLDTFSKNIKDIEYKYIATNIETGKDCPLNEAIKKGKIVRSVIKDKKGHKYGLIGAMPPDLKKHLSPKVNLKDFFIDNFEQTRKAIQAEINSLEKQGINKIILLSHMGYKNDRKLAPKVSGLDVIIGGHSHHLVKGMTPGKNYLRGADGNPVAIVQAGKNGKNFGVLDLIFNKNGVIKNISNTIKKTDLYKEDKRIKGLIDKFLGKIKPLAWISNIASAKNNVEKPIAGFAADAMKEKANAEIALINTEKIRGKFNTGMLTDRELDESMPIANDISKVNISEKDLVNALNFAIKQDDALQVSGLKYTISKNNTVKDLYYIDKNKNRIKIDTKNPNPYKTYTAVYDNYLMQGDHDNIALKKKDSEKLEVFNWKMIDIVKEKLLARHFMPLTLKQNDRIKIES